MTLISFGPAFNHLSGHIKNALGRFEYIDALLEFLASDVQREQEFNAIELESRVLYSASPIPTDLVDLQVDLESQVMESLEFFEQVELNGSESPTWDQAADLDVALMEDARALVTGLNSATHLIFIDSEIADLSFLASELANENSEVVVLDSESNGLDQITRILSTRQDIASIHVISHGSEGQVQLGNTTLSSQNIGIFASQLASWSTSFSDDADILFYGCNLAQSEDGQTLIETIAQLTDTDVAASEDLTGHQSLGGDWDLEFRTGQLDSEMVITAAIQQEWVETLVAPTITVVADQNVSTGQNFNVQLSLVDPDNDTIVGWTVVWGDGSSDTILGDSTSLTVNHAYSDDGLYDILVSVEDVTGVYSNSMAIIPSQNNSDLNFYDFQGNFQYSESGGSLDGPENVILGPDGLLYVTSFHDGTVKRYGTDGNYADGSLPHFFDSGPNQGATGLAFDGDGILYVANYAADEIFKVDSDGNASLFLDSSDGLNGPVGLDFSADGTLFVSNRDGNSILRFDSSGTSIGRFDDPGDLDQPAYITFGENGNLFVARQADNEVDVFDSTGDLINNISHGTLEGSGRQVRGVAIGPDGLLYITASDPHSNASNNDSRIETFNASNGNRVGGFLANPVANMSFPGSVFFTPELQVNASTPTINAEDDNYSTDENSQISVDAINGLLTNDSTEIQPVPNPALSFDAGVDDNGNNIWENQTIATGLDLSIESGIVRQSNPNSPAGIGAEYVLNGNELHLENSLADLPTGDPTQNSASFEFWIRPDNGVGGDVLLDVGNQISGTTLMMNGTSLDLIVNHSNSGTELSASADLSSLIATNPNDQEFIHIVAVIDLDGPSTAKLYVNGTRMDTSNTSSLHDWAFTGEFLSIGGLRGSGIFSTTPNNFQGSIGAFRLYTSALSDSQVQQNYDSAFLSVVSADSVSTNGATVNVNSDGSFIYDPSGVLDSLNVGESITDTFSYTIENAEGDTDTATASITVTGVNDAPIINNNRLTVSDGQTVVLSSTHFRATDVDNDDSTLTFTISNLTGGQFALIGNQSVPILSFTQAQVSSGQIVFVHSGGNVTPSYDVEVTDGDLTDGPLSANITFLPSNTPPTTVGIPDLIIDEDSVPQLFDLELVFSDVEDSSSILNYSLVNITNASLFEILAIDSSNILRLKPAADQNGTSAVTVRATDSEGLSVSTTFLVTVNPVNDTPTVVGGPLFIDRNEDAGSDQLNLESMFDDVDIATNNDTLTYSIVSNSNNSLVSTSIVGNELMLDYQANQSGTATVTVMAMDSAGETVTNDIVITITPSNDPPTVVSPMGSRIANEDDPNSTIDLDTVFSDVDDSSLTYSIISNTNPTIVSVSLIGNTLTLDHLDNQFGQSEITIRATDSNGSSVEDTLTLEILPINDAPIVSNPIADFAVVEDSVATVLNLEQIFDDIDGEPLTYSIVSNSNSSVIESTILGNELRFVYLPNQFGVGEIVIRATDANGLSVDDSVEITVTPANDAPVVTAPIGTITVPEDSPNTVIDLTTVFSDIDDSTLSYTIIDNSSSNLVAANILGSSIELAYQPNQTGNATIKIRATDANGLSVDDIIHLVVTPENDSPELISPIADWRVLEDSAPTQIDLSTVFADLDGDQLTYSVVSNSGPEIVNFTITDNQIHFDYLPDQFGTVEMVIQATDSGGLHAQDTFEIAVTPVNDAPVASSLVDQVVVDEDAPISNLDIGSVFEDVDDTQLTYSIVSSDNPDIVQATLNDNVLSLEYQENQYGSSIVVIRATDTHGESAEHRIAINVEPVNDAPVVVDHDYRLTEGGDVSGNVLASSSDLEGDTLTAELVTRPANGTVQLNANGTFTYTPDPGFFGVDSFEFIANDGSGVSETALATIRVSAAPIVTEPKTDPENNDEEENIEAILLPPPQTADKAKGADVSPQQASARSASESFSTNPAAESELNERVTFTETRIRLNHIRHLSVEANLGVEVVTQLTSTSVQTIPTQFFSSLVSFSEEIDQATNSINYTFVNSIVSLSGVSLGVVTWFLRTGAFLASMMANLPAWRIVDPLTVLGYSSEDDENAESLQDIIENGSQSTETSSPVTPNATTTC